MDRDRIATMRKPYRRQSIPKDECLVREAIPAIQEAAEKLHEACTCSLLENTIRPASETDEEYFAALADLYRCYRWLAGEASIDDMKIKDHYAQCTIRALSQGIEVVERVIPFTEPFTAHPWIRVAIRDAMTCGMQALANCVRNSTSVQDSVWPQFFEIIGSLIILEEDKLLNCICAVIMNCLTDSRLDEIVDRGYAARIFERISCFGAREDSLVAFEAIFDLSRFLLRSPLVAERDYDLLPLTARCTILDLLSSSFSMRSNLNPNTHENSDEFWHESLLPTFWPEKVAEEFKNNCMCLTRLSQHSSVIDEECELILKVLNLLGNVTASDSLRHTCFRDMLLLDRVIELFLAIDEIGRTGDNLFSPVTKMANIKPQELVTPSRGLKSQLLRLVANLVYENPAFEMRARDTGLAHRLRDSTRVDYRNPYVQQWAILAIRNLHFSGLLEEIRKEQEMLPVPTVPVAGLAHSVDGDMMGERKRTDGLASHRVKGFQCSDTFEALDLHTSFNESLSPGSRAKPGTASVRKEHKSSKSQRRPSKSGKTFESQETQTGEPSSRSSPSPPLIDGETS